MQRTESEQVPAKALTEKPKPKASSGVKRNYSLQQKLQVVRETLGPGVSVARVARRHNINANLVFTWRRQYSRGELAPVAGQEFIPLGTVGDDLPALPPPPESRLPDGWIEIETAARMKVRVSGRVDERMLALVMAELRRRP